MTTRAFPPYILLAFALTLAVLTLHFAEQYRWFDRFGTNTLPQHPHLIGECATQT